MTQFFLCLMLFTIKIKVNLVAAYKIFFPFLINPRLQVNIKKYLFIYVTCFE